MKKKPIADNADSGNKTDSADSPVEAKRRKAVKRIAATAGIVATMSGKWEKPVLSSAILPAHAGMTGDAIEDGEQDG